MPTSSASSPTPEPSPNTASELLQSLFPPLRTYWPNLPSVSAPQAAFLLLDCLEAGYGGAAAGGKSDALLAGALQYVDQPNYAALILRRSFADLALPGAIMSRSHEWLQGKARWADRDKTWTFPTGAKLAFGYLDNANDVYRYQSSEFQYVAFDELTQFPEAQYQYLFSRLRRKTTIKVPIRMRWASNPGGVGHGWVKRDYIAAATRKQGAVFIPARIADNPGVEADEYRLSLSHLNHALQAQLMEGDWGAFEGAAYEDLREDLHVVPAFDLPASFVRFEAMDHGVTNPTAWLLFATDYDGNTIVCDEYYAPGLPEEHAARVKERRADWWEAKDEDGWPQRHPCHGDPASLRESLPTANAFGEPLTLQEIYQRHGVRIVPANNRRRAGYVAVRELLHPDPERRFPLWHPRAGEVGAPRLFVVGERCSSLLDQMRSAPLATREADPERGEAVDRVWESAHGHAHAALRYGLTTRPMASKEPEQEPADPRAAAIARRMQRSRKPKSRFVDV